MKKPQPLSVLLGLDIGWVNTHTSYFGISDGKYRLQDTKTALTSLGNGLHIGAGVGEAMRRLQAESDHVILNDAGRLLKPVNKAGEGVDRVVLTTSAGPWLETALFGLTQDGSLHAGRTLIDSLPLKLSGEFGLGDLDDETGVIDSLVNARPEFYIITGGEDAGAESLVHRWVEIVRLVSRLLPPACKPAVVFAGNPLLEGYVRRRLELLSNLHIASNLQPEYGDLDLVPAQVVLEKEILRAWQGKLSGLSDLIHLANNQLGTKSFSMGRMVRYLSRANVSDSAHKNQKGLLAVDLGGGSTTISVGKGGQTGVVIQPAWEELTESINDEVVHAVQQWTAVPVSAQEVFQYLINFALNHRVVPDNLKELALSQALARIQLRSAVEKFSRNYPWLTFKPDMGMAGHYEPVIASGSVLTQAPTPGQAMMILLDGLQPRGVTTIILDRYHILSLLGMIGVETPVLPVQVLESDAFMNLGTVVTAVSHVPEGENLLNVDVKTDHGKEYSLGIPQGTFRRLLIPVGETAVIELEPTKHTDVGFGECGKGGRLKAPGGVLGLVIDARGRPLELPNDNETRVEKIRQWLWALGG